MDRPCGRSILNGEYQMRSRWGRTSTVIERVMERDRGREIFKISLSLLGLAAIAFLSNSFPHETKDEAFHRQGCVCPVCKRADHKLWEGHHSVPDSLGGSTAVENCITVGGDGHRDCHEQLDQKALRGTIFLPPNGPFVPITEALPEQFKNEDVRSAVIYRFMNGLPLSGKVRKIPMPHRTKQHRGRKHYRGQGR